MYDSRFIRTLAVGSRVVCPELATEETDEDILAWMLPSRTCEIILGMTRAGWEVTKRMIPGKKYFYSARRKGDRCHYIIVVCKRLFERYIKANELCKHLHLTNKEDRIAVHNMLIHGRLDVSEMEVDA